jgi:2-polyprenyl-3-methyl-5-hydroxy-6-metoxy-1,4-benzoquinol methylase
MNKSNYFSLVDLQNTLYKSRNPTRRWLHNTRKDKIISVLNSYEFINTQKAMEVGPGSGIYLQTLCNRFDSVTAIDIEEIYIDNLCHMKDSLKNLKLLNTDICDGTLDDHFDLVLCTEVIEHVNNPIEFFKSLTDAIVFGGMLVISTPQPFSIMELCCKIALSKYLIALTRLVYKEPVLPNGHISLLSHRQILKLLSQNNFEIISIDFFGLYLPVISELFGNKAVWFAIRAEWLIKFIGLDFLLWTQLYVAKKK